MSHHSWHRGNGFRRGIQDWINARYLFLDNLALGRRQKVSFPFFNVYGHCLIKKKELLCTVARTHDKSRRFLSKGIDISRGFYFHVSHSLAVRGIPPLDVSWCRSHYVFRRKFCFFLLFTLNNSRARSILHNMLGPL